MALTKKDLDQIRKMIVENNVTLAEAIEERLGITIDSKIDKKLDEKLKHLPTKEEFYAQMDKIMKELKDLRDEVAVSAHRSSENTDKTEKLEGRVFKN